MITSPETAGFQGSLCKLQEFALLECLFAFGLFIESKRSYERHYISKDKYCIIKGIRQPPGPYLSPYFMVVHISLRAAD